MHGARQPARSIAADQSLPKSFAGVVRFYVPLATTMLFVWGGRAVLLSVVARAPDGLVALAAWPAAWGLVLSVANATRMVQQVVISSPGEATTSQLFQFVVLVGLTCSVLLAFFGFVPSGQNILAHFFGGDRALASAALPAVKVSAVFPLLLAVQNAFQGFLIRDGKTSWIQGATLAGVTMTLAIAWVLVAAGIRGATAAACAMVVGVSLEVAVLAIGLKCRGRFSLRRAKSE